MLETFPNLIPTNKHTNKFLLKTFNNVIIQRISNSSKDQSTGHKSPRIAPWIRLIYEQNFAFDFEICKRVYPKINDIGLNLGTKFWLQTMLKRNCVINKFMLKYSPGSGGNIENFQKSWVEFIIGLCFVCTGTHYQFFMKQERASGLKGRHLKYNITEM